MKAPECEGWVDLFNFPPNNWEKSDFAKKFVNVTWVEDNIWRSKSIYSIKPDESISINIRDLSFVPESKLALLSLTKNSMPALSEFLPATDDCYSRVPNWRSSLGLYDVKGGQVSYQGEIDPFPHGASMISFASFEQKSKNIENYFIFVNIEKSPIYRKSDLGIYDPLSMRLLKNQVITNNSITIINFDDLSEKEENLLLFASENMAGIPLYFSRNKITRQMSLEHTHPPASFAIHGKRFAVQQELKKIWFERIKNTI